MQTPTIAYSRFTEYDIYLFRQGKHFKIYEKLGSHLTEHKKKKGTYFAVWAPNANAVSVIGVFNQWKSEANPLFPRLDGSGIWEGFIEGVGQGALYKYSILSPAGQRLEKSDPYARYWEMRPQTASKVWQTDYQWQDDKWMRRRKKTDKLRQAQSVYEVHLGSWRKKDDGTEHGFLTYREIATQLVPYVADMGFTHVELMPVMEHPYDPSWGYQITGYYAPTSRFGTPEDLMYLVDCFHRAGIGVIMDWVPSHFPQDGHALGYFDGTHLYEHEDPRKGYHPDWESLIFNYGRNEVRSFLISNAIFWAEQFHADGLRVDAVASMLYLDYSRDDGQWIPNQYGGNENLEAISFLKEMNTTVHNEFPDVLTIAEESTAFYGVSQPVENGGLGFDQKWMMGWMHDTLRYFQRPPIYRQYHHNEITFSMVYAYSEKYMLPLSHDEVVHGKGSLFGRMPGDEWQQFANLRTLYGYMFTHPGTKLLFMGGEIAQYLEWNFMAQLDWQLLERRYNKGVQTLIKDLNHLYQTKKALYEHQFEDKGFEWMAYDDNQNGIISYIRQGKKKNDLLLVVCNFQPNTHDTYEIGISKPSTWTLLLNTDAEKYGGSAFEISDTLHTIEVPKHGKAHQVVLKIPPLSCIIYEGKITKKQK